MTSLTVLARRLSFIRETEGPNRGAWVSMLQRYSGGKDGDSWCAAFVSFVLDVAYHGRPPFPRTESTAAMLDHARAAGATTVVSPQRDDLYFYVNPVGFPHHVGIVTSTVPLMGIAGNTSEDGASDNGTGVYEHAISSDPARVIFVRL